MAAPLEGRIKVALASIMKILELDLTEFVLQEDPDKSPEENLQLLEKSMDEYSLNLEDLKDNREEVQNAIADWTDLLRKMGQNERPAGDARYAAFEANLHLDEFCGQADDAIHSWKRIRSRLTRSVKNLDQSNKKKGSQVKVALPQLHLSKFSGDDPNMWPEWWELYSISVDNNFDLTPENKFLYLKTFLTAPAADVVKGFVPKEYDDAITLLTDTYGQKEKRIRTLYQQLAQLPQCHSLDDLKSFQIALERICRQLETEKEVIDGKSFYWQLETKLTRQILRDMNEAKKKVGNAWTTKMFRKELKELLESELGLSDILKHGKESKTDKNEKIANQQKEGKKELAKAGKEPTVSCGTVGDQNSQEEKGQQQEVPSTSKEQSKPPLNCFFCGEQHWANKCKKYKTVAQREKRLKEVGRCIHCMKNGHADDDCPRPLTCVKCKEHHPLALCPNWKAPATDDEANNSGRSSPDTSSEPNPKEYVAASTITIYPPLKLSQKEILDDGNLYPIISGALINQIDEIMIDASDLQEELGYDVTPPENTEARAAIESKAPAKKKLKSVEKMVKKNKIGQSCSQESLFLNQDVAKGGPSKQQSALAAEVNQHGPIAPIPNDWHWNTVEDWEKILQQHENGTLSKQNRKFWLTRQFSKQNRTFWLTRQFSKQKRKFWLYRPFSKQKRNFWLITPKSEELATLVPENYFLSTDTQNIVFVLGAEADSLENSQKLMIQMGELLARLEVYQKKIVLVLPPALQGNAEKQQLMKEGLKTLSLTCGAMYIEPVFSMMSAIPEYVDKYGGPTEKGFEDLEGLLAIRGIHFEKVTPKMKSNQKKKEMATRTPIYSRLKRIRGATGTASTSATAAMASLPIVRGEDGFAKEMLKKKSAFGPCPSYFQNISGYLFVANQKGAEEHRPIYKKWRPNMYHADSPMLKPTIFRPIVEVPLSMFMAADLTEDGLKLTHWKEKKQPIKIDKEESFSPIGGLKEKFWKEFEDWHWYWLTGVGGKVSIDIFMFLLGLLVDVILDKLKARGWFTSSWRLDWKKKATAEEKMPEGKSRKFEKWQTWETGFGGLNVDKQ